MKKTKTIEIDQKEIEALIKRVESHCLREGDYELIVYLISTVINVNEQLTKKNISIKRLKKLFNIQTEKSSNILPKDRPVNEQGQIDKLKEEKKIKGHGRIRANCYKNAERIHFPHTKLKIGGNCPDCLKGKLYNNIPDSVYVKITAKEIFKATVYTQENIRCNLCGKVFKAPLPSDFTTEKYDATVSAMIALLKYSSGLPFNRIDVLQKGFNVPIPSSTQWDIIAKSKKYNFPVYERLVFMAAQGEVVYNDDTNMKVLSLIKENKQRKKSERKGIFTTGIISRLKDGKEIVLYYTGRNHAGENLADLLAHRLQNHGPPIQMCDALSRNPPKEFKTLLANCLSHGRRQFVDLVDNFPDECTYVIETLAEVYHNDSITKETGLNKEQRLSYHQSESGPLMEKLKTWMEKQLSEKKVEPNSSLGEAIDYMLSHWEKLTLFLKIPGAPLDNNICEQALKKAILHRKNSMFYKTENGAETGDMYMSIIQTCNLANVNPFNYMVALQEHAEDVKTNLDAWLPWNYHIQLEKKTKVSVKKQAD